MKEYKYKWDNHPIEPSWYEPVFWLIVLSIFLIVTCALWYVVFRAIGIVL